MESHSWLWLRDLIEGLMRTPPEFVRFPDESGEVLKAVPRTRIQFALWDN